MNNGANKAAIRRHAGVRRDFPGPMLMETSAPPHLLMDSQQILPGGTHTIQMESGFPCPSSSSLNSGSASSQSQSAASTTTQTIVQIQTAETNNNQIQHQNSHSQQHHHHFNSLSRVKSLDSCRVCGDGPARMHYGVPTCFGCKGFFRRTLKRTKEYTCRYAGNCVVDRYERNSCRFCRFKRCLEVGMDPKAVRPDRDAAGRSHPVRRRMSRGNMLGGTICETAFTAEQDLPADTAAAPSDTDEWVRKLPVEMRTLLMQIMNMEAMVHHGDTHESAKNLYPLQFPSIRHIFEDPSCLDGKRTEIRYEPYRQVEPEELTYLAHRRLIATVDTVDHLCALMDLHNPRDKIILAKAAYAPLTLFCAVSATARVTRNRDRLCLCNYGFVPRGAHLSYAEPYHFANRLVDRALDELVEPFRAFNFKEQEIVLMKAIVALNPYLPNLSTEATEQVADFRDRLQETLYNVVRESHPKEVASSRFGNLLLFLPNVMMLASIMMENLQFIQSFRHQDIGPLLSELLEDGDPESGQQAMLEDGSSSDLEQSMRHSLSSHSLASHSQSSDNLSTLLGTSGSSFQTQYSAPNLSGSMPTLVSSKQSQPQLASNDSDPDYNVTLTAESLRQQAAQHQQMEVDSPPESHPPALASSPLLFPSQKPQFFIDPANGFAANQPPPQSEVLLMSRTTVAASKHVFTVEKSAGPPGASCCREKSATGGTSVSQCRNGECPAALAAIFQQQQQQQQRFENNDTGIFFLGMQQGGQQPQNNSNTAIAKSQSFPYFDPFFGAADSGDNSGSGGGGGGGGMPSSASHDNFHQMQR